MYSKPQIPQTKDADSEGSHSNPLIKYEPEIRRHDNHREGKADGLVNRVLMQPAPPQTDMLQMKTNSDNINRLQMQSIGNAGLVIQPRLTIDRPGDQYEKQADRIAEKVVNGKDPVISRDPEIKGVQLQEEEELLQPKSFAEQITPLVQRQEEEEEEELLQPKLLSAEHQTLQKQAEPGEEEEKPGQTKKPDELPATGSAIESRLKSAKGSGQTMDNRARENMESSLGADFSNVRIHAGADAVQMNKELGAKAFTHGRDVYFNSGKYRPESSDGRRLLAHELVHVLQQNGVRKNIGESPGKINYSSTFIQRTSTTSGGITWYSSQGEAVANVPAHVSPRACFIWRGGSNAPAGHPWRVIPGTGCAHWVAHELGITGTPGCNVGNAIRVSQVVSGRTQHAITDAQVGDVWTNISLSHTGLVRALNRDTDGNVVSLQVEHCSSRQGGVVTNNFSSGHVYR